MADERSATGYELFAELGRLVGRLQEESESNKGRMDDETIRKGFEGMSYFLENLERRLKLAEDDARREREEQSRARVEFLYPFSFGGEIKVFGPIGDPALKWIPDLYWQSKNVEVMVEQRRRALEQSRIQHRIFYQKLVKRRKRLGLRFQWYDKFDIGKDGVR